MFKKAEKLYHKLQNLFKTASKKWTETQNVSENLSIELYLDDLPSMPPLEGDEEVKLEPEETISERVKSNPRKKNEGKGLKILTPDKLLTRLIDF